jgi:mono/diheme cytochrome c family protein
MAHMSRKTGVLLLGLLVAAGGAMAQQKIDIGKREFDTNCASCHGVKAKGDGVLKPYLTRSAPDLTVLAKANGGILPMDRMYDVIEGAREVPGHGTRDMPAWGMDYKIKAAEYYYEVPYDPEVYVRAKILSLLEYLNRLQVK